MTTELYNLMRVQQEAAGENKDCTVKALAIAAGVSYQEARAALKRHGRKDGRGATKQAVIRAAKDLGKSIAPVRLDTLISKYPGVHKTLANVTTLHPKRFHGAWEDGKTYVAFSKGHALAIINGVVHDWSAERSLRIKSMYRVN